MTKKLYPGPSDVYEDLKEGKESKSRKNKQEEVMRWDTSKVNIGMVIMMMVLVDCYIDDDGKRRRCGGIPAAL